MIIPDPRQSTQWVKHMSGQPLPRGPYTATITTNFLVVDCPTAYNVILGRTGINDLKAMVSTHMLLMKFPTPYGNGYIREDQLSARSCYNTSVKQ
ncbi:hypothetical protein COP1_022105 [Malus domestica]